MPQPVVVVLQNAVLPPLQSHNRVLVSYARVICAQIVWVGSSHTHQLVRVCAVAVEAGLGRNLTCRVTLTQQYRR